jgi:hypothetical protein
LHAVRRHWSIEKYRVRTAVGKARVRKFYSAISKDVYELLKMI